MISRSISVIARGLALVVLAVPGISQAADAPACAAVKAPSGELAPWIVPGSLASAGDVAALSAAALPLGKAVDLSLHPADHVRLPVPAGKPGGNSGLARLTIVETGSYRVALGVGAWVDLASGGKAIASVAHGHGEACTGVRKVVEFNLQPGDYTVVISGSPEPRARILVARKP